MKTDYTRKAAPNQVHLVTIECLFSDHNRSEEEDVLDNLRQYGAAGVVKRELVAESFEAANSILQRRVARAKT